MSWADARQNFQSRLDTITTSVYGGDQINQYEQLILDIQAYLRNNSSRNDIDMILADTSALQHKNHILHKQAKQTTIDTESALARNELLRSNDSAITSHQLFLLDHPVRRERIPYLWVLAVLFVGIGLVILSSMNPLSTMGATNVYGASSMPFTFQTVLLMIYEFVTNRVVLISLMISSLIVILAMTMKYVGVIGQ
jgi:hypothetical protein